MSTTTTMPNTPIASPRRRRSGGSTPRTQFDPYSTPSRRGRHRQRYNPVRRLEVAEVRKEGACTTCRIKKVRCVHALQARRVLFGPRSTLSTSDETRESSAAIDTRHHTQDDTQWTPIITASPSYNLDIEQSPTFYDLTLAEKLPTGSEHTLPQSHLAAAFSIASAPDISSPSWNLLDDSTVPALEESHGLNGSRLRIASMEDESSKSSARQNGKKTQRMALKLKDPNRHIRRGNDNDQPAKYPPCNRTSKLKPKGSSFHIPQDEVQLSVVPFGRDQLSGSSVTLDTLMTLDNICEESQNQNSLVLLNQWTGSVSFEDFLSAPPAIGNTILNEMIASQPFDVPFDQDVDYHNGCNIPMEGVETSLEPIFDSSNVSGFEASLDPLSSLEHFHSEYFEVGSLSACHDNFTSVANGSMTESIDADISSSWISVQTPSTNKASFDFLDTPSTSSSQASELVTPVSVAPFSWPVPVVACGMVPKNSADYTVHLEYLGCQDDPIIID